MARAPTPSVCTTVQGETRRCRGWRHCRGVANGASGRASQGGLHDRRDTESTRCPGVPGQWPDPGCQSQRAVSGVAGCGSLREFQTAVARQSGRGGRWSGSCLALHRYAPGRVWSGSDVRDRGSVQGRWPARPDAREFRAPARFEIARALMAVPLSPGAAPALGSSTEIATTPVRWRGRSGVKASGVGGTGRASRERRRA